MLEFTFKNILRYHWT